MDDALVSPVSPPETVHKAIKWHANANMLSCGHWALLMSSQFQIKGKSEPHPNAWLAKISKQRG
jgi:hypothetical protein